MSKSQDFLESIEAKLSELSSVEQLVELGLFSSVKEAKYRRYRKQPPDYIPITYRRVAYPKSAVLEWLKQRASLCNHKICQTEDGDSSSIHTPTTDLVEV